MIGDAIHKDRGSNAQHQFVDAVQMIVIGLIAGATSMAQVVKVWSDEMIPKMAWWDGAPVDTTLGRIMKTVSQGDVAEMTGVIHLKRRRIFFGSIINDGKNAK